MNMADGRADRAVLLWFGSADFVVAEKTAWPSKISEGRVRQVPEAR